MEACKVFPELLRNNSPYFLEKLIGFGAYSSVCSARRKSDGEEVAIKKIFNWQKDPNEKVRTMREVELMEAFVQSPEILTLQEVHTYDPNLLLVSEKMDCDLSTRIQSCRKIDVKERRHILQSILKAFIDIHSANVIHRDIKPKNILMKGKQVVLADFGMARKMIFPLDKKQRRMSLLEYTTSGYYCPPEGLMNCWTYGSEVDIWALGCIWIEMLTKDKTFGVPSSKRLCAMASFCGETLESMEEIVNTLPTSDVHKTRAITQLNSSLNIEQFVTMDKLLENTEVTRDEITLLQSIFQMDPKKRTSASELLSHPFFLHYM